MSLLNVDPSASNNFEPYRSPSKINRSGRNTRKSFGFTYTHYVDIPFSSPLGIHIIKNSRLQKSGRYQAPVMISEYEKCIPAKPGNYKAFKERSDRWTVTYRPPRSGHGRRWAGSEWSHTYCFNSREREEKGLTLKTGEATYLIPRWV